MPSSSSTIQAAYDWDYLCKFILIGDSSVGKSSLLLRATDDRFLAEEAEPTVGVEFGSLTLSLNPHSDEPSRGGASTHPPTSAASPPSGLPHSPRSPNVKIQIWDTSGSEAFRGITRSYYRGAAGCLLVYDVTHRPSFSNAKSWLKDVRDHAEEDAVVVLVGNRIDLADGNSECRGRTVQTDEAEEWADAQGILFVETSAKTGHNVRHAFEACVREIHQRFTAAQASSSSADNRKLLKSRTGSSGRGFDGQVRLDEGGNMMTRSGCCCVM